MALPYQWLVKVKEPVTAATNVNESVNYIHVQSDTLLLRLDTASHDRDFGLFYSKLQTACGTQAFTILPFGILSLLISAIVVQ